MLLWDLRPTSQFNSYINQNSTFWFIHSGLRIKNLARLTLPKKCESIWAFLRGQKRILTSTQQSECACLRKLMKRMKIFDFQEWNTKFSSCQNPRSEAVAPRRILKLNHWIKTKNLARLGIEPRTRGFSVLCSTNWANEPKCFNFLFNFHFVSSVGEVFYLLHFVRNG